ncbi:response regulator transcription factor [Ramlibacter humi]|nr:response regulator [Ramlibacter humi]
MRNSHSAPAHFASVLVADDNPDITEMLAAFLQLSGFRVQCAANGVEAVECFDRERPDVAVLDIQMPMMDGLAAARHMKARHPGVLLIAATGRPDLAVAAGSSAPFARVFCKPVSADEIVSAIRSHLSAGNSLRKTA